MIHQDSGDSSGSAWSLLVCAWLTFIMLTGGVASPHIAIWGTMLGSSIVLLLIGLVRLHGGFPTGLAAFGTCLALLVLVAANVQLVPLPYDLWSSLPGREIYVRSFNLLEMSPVALPLSLSPAETRLAILALLPPIAGFVAALSLPQKHLWRIALAVVLCALVGMIVAILQRMQGSESQFFFYGVTEANKGVRGTFYNRNFFAAQLFCSLPFVAALGTHWASKMRHHGWLVSVFVLIYVGATVAILSSVGSRGGIVFAMASLLLSAIFVFRTGAGKARMSSVLIVLLVGLFVIAQAGLVSILRFASTDVNEDARVSIYELGLKAAETQFPAGSGLGTFVPVFQLFETNESIMNAFINRAHNDWLEAAIEGGLPAIVLMVLFLVGILYGLARALRLSPTEPTHAFIRAGGLAAALLLAHAVFDFPLRMPGLAAFLGLSCGLLCLAGGVVRSGAQATRSRNSTEARSQGPRTIRQPQPFRPAERRFGPKTASAEKAPDDPTRT